MTTAAPVPATTRHAEEPSADDAAATLRRAGARHLVAASLVRFRAGDGSTTARAVGVQLMLALVPLGIALVGLSSAVRVEGVGRVLDATLLALVPGGSDAVGQALEQGGRATSGTARLALGLGLVTALSGLTSAMAQIERACNRIYGLARDRPLPARYGRAALLALLAGVPALTGFLLLVAGGPALDALAEVYGPPQAVLTALGWLRWPLGAVLDLAAVTAIFRIAPHRRQPDASWFTVGAGVAVLLWLVFTGALAGYVRLSSSFGTVYGPLTGIVAITLWSQLTSVALLLGISFAAQLEAEHAGSPGPTVPGPGHADDRTARGG